MRCSRGARSDVNPGRIAVPRKEDPAVFTDHHCDQSLCNRNASVNAIVVQLIADRCRPPSLGFLPWNWSWNSKQEVST
jgi:hypothetical protein